ncbi:MAG TPA: hypothetical protein DCL41_09620 [Bdellovibrionales bacterium]|nr:hypothetical protein [Bdellovibrionales bacterium]
MGSAAVLEQPKAYKKQKEKEHGLFGTKCSQKPPPDWKRSCQEIGTFREILKTKVLEILKILLSR